MTADPSLSAPRPTEPSVDKNKLGIDFNVALDILSQRTATIDNAENTITSSTDSNNASATTTSLSESKRCDCRQNLVSFDPNDLPYKKQQPQQNLGQVIDVGSALEDQDSLDERNVYVETDPVALQKKREQQATQEQARQRRDQLLTTIQSMPINEIISTIFQTQEERVRTYRFYDDGLEYVLKTGSIEKYPFLCADVTATFTVLSSTINAIRTNLNERNNTSMEQSTKEVVVLINRLQLAEQTKLQLTAAIHLEQIRYKGVQLELQQLDHVNDDNIEETTIPLQQQNTAVLSLLEDSMKTLRRKIASSMEEVNDVLEELRYVVNS